MISPLFPKLSLAGMLGEDALLGRNPFLATVTAPTRVRLEGKRLVWWFESDQDGMLLGNSRNMRHADPTGMLDAFVRLQDAEDVLRFAQGYGVIEACEHEIPATHNRPHVLDYPWEELPPRGQRTWCMPLGAGSAKWSAELGFHGAETLWAPLELWFCLARLARALLNIAASLHQGERGAFEDWRLLTDAAGEGKAEVLAKVLAGTERQQGIMAGLGYYIPREAPGQLYLAAAVTEWLSMANIRPILRWSVYTSDEPSILLVGGSPTCVFGPLGVQLMLAVNRAQSVTLCSGCGNLYLRQGRKPQAGRHNYCPTCGERVANRDRQRALQARRRQGEQTQTLRDKANQQTSAGKHEWGRA